MLISAIVNVGQLVETFGYPLLFATVAAESSGVPIPGETALITAAVLASQGKMEIALVIPIAALAAIVGDNIGYAIGRFGGYRALRRYGSKVGLSEAKLKVGMLVFERQGGKVIFFGRFVSILRTYAAFLAGVNRMSYYRFFAFNAAGGVVWSAIYAFGFYFAGSTLKRVRGPFDAAIGLGAAVIIVVAFAWLRHNEKRLEAEAEAAYPGPLDDHIERKRRALEA